MRGQHNMLLYWQALGWSFAWRKAGYKRLASAALDYAFGFRPRRLPPILRFGFGFRYLRGGE